MTITADQIAEYLQDHLDFFEQHPKLVRELILPTNSGAAISLVEFQLRKLRDRIQQLERENDHMIEIARINSVLFEKTRSLVLSLLDARDLDDLSVVLDEKLANGFDIPVVRLLLSDQFKIPDSLSLIQSVKAESLEDGGQLAQSVADKEPVSDDSQKTVGVRYSAMMRTRSRVPRHLHLFAATPTECSL